MNKYRIIYLISNDCVIEIGRKGIFTTNPDKYKAYISRIDSKNTITYLDELIKDFTDTKSPIFEINQIIDNSNRSYLTGSKC